MTAAAPRNASQRPVRVLLVDDSAVVRGLTRRWLDGEPRIELAGVSSDGEQGVAEAARLAPDVIILDVEMPRMDGLTALPLLRKAAPGARIIMASTLTSVGAGVTIRALTLGASDYIAKPDASALGGADAYRAELVAKVIALGERATRGSAPVIQRPVNLRAKPRLPARPTVMAVAASTGGPAALQAFLAPIARRVPAPILLVQHMPASFTPVFAEKLAQATGRACREAADGDALASDTMLLAPGDWHMRVARGPAGHIVRVDQTLPVNFCRPAADPLFDSVADAFGARVLCVVLTGMGHDGRDGAGRIAAAGGRVIVQDEASSVVWGMPGSVATAGHAEAVRPLNELSSLALDIMNGAAA